MIKSLVLFQQLFIKLCISHIYILDQSYVDDYCLIHIGSHCFNTMLNCFFFRSLEVVVSAPIELCLGVVFFLVVETLAEGDYEQEMFKFCFVFISICIW